MKKSAGKHNNKLAGFYVVIAIYLVVSIAFSMTVRADDNSAAVPAESITTTAEITEATEAPAPIATTSPVTALKPAVTGTVKQSTTSQLANLIGGLALILALIYGLSWFVKRFSQGGFMQNSNIKMLSAMPLGTRERLMLVDVGGKQMLLGVTAGQINMLHVFDQPVVDAEDKNNRTQAGATTSEFSQKLMAILQQKGSTTIPSDHKNIKE